MKRIIVGQIMHESSSLALNPTEESNFRQTLIWFEGKNVFDLSTIGMKDYLTGIMEKGQELQMDISPCFCTFASPSGKISVNCFNTLKEKFFSNIDQSSPIDGFCIALHGAGVSEADPDIEGNILEEIRRRFGYSIPVIVTLDPHANITAKMIQYADLLLPSKLYPHTDTYETGQKAALLMNKILSGDIHPVMQVKKLPLLIPLNKGCTEEFPMKDVLEKCLEYENTPGVLYCSFAHGFPYSDIEECGASVVVITDGDTELAETLSQQLADLIFRRRKDFISDGLTVQQGVDKVQELLSEGSKLIVMNEISDNPGAGTPGDGTYLLRELLNRNLPGTCVGVLIDPEAADLAAKAGAGSYISLKLGGKTDERHGKPIELEDVYVKSICDGKYNLLSPMTHGQPVNYGTTVRLQKGNVDIIVGSQGFQTMDDGVFTLLGIDVRQYNIVAVKSAQHFKAYFKHLADHIISVDPPGISSGNLQQLPLKHIKRPVFPLDEEEI